MDKEELDKLFETARKVDSDETVAAKVRPYKLIVQDGVAWVNVEGTWRTLGGLIEECMDAIWL